MSAPRDFMSAMNDGSSSAAFAESWSTFSAGPGVPFGAVSTNHVPIPSPSPSSLPVGASGKAGCRCGLATASTRSFFASTSGFTSPGCAIAASTCPPSKAGLVSPQPENGTVVVLKPPGTCHRLGGGDELLHGLPRRVCLHGEEREERDRVQDGLVVVRRLVRQLVELRMDHQGRVRREDDGVAVGLR